MYDVITIGSNTVDVFIQSFSELIKILTPKYEQDHIAYPEGSKIIIEKLLFDLGGGGTNSAVCLSRLGLKVAYIGCAGTDQNGKLVLRRLEKEKVKFLGTQDNKHQSGYSLILESIENDRCILTFKGTNDYLDFNSINPDAIYSKWIYCTSMLHQSLKTTEKIFRLAKKRNIKIAFNPSEYMIKDNALLTRLLKMIDILIVNDREAYLVSNKKGVENQFKRILKMGPKGAIITEGADGAGYADKTGAWYASSRKVKVVEVTGAGDAFGSSFIAALIMKKSVPFALNLATTNACSVLGAKGAKTNLLTYNEALKGMKEKITIKKLVL